MNDINKFAAVIIKEFGIKIFDNGRNINVFATLLTIL